MSQVKTADPIEFARLAFDVELWDRQKEILRAVATHPRVAVRSGHKIGKAARVDQPVLTTDGFKPIGDIEVGDIVFDEHGRQTEVTHVSDTWADRPCYEVTFDDRTSVVVDEEHEWVTWTHKARKAAGRAKNPRSGPERITTLQMSKTLQTKNSGRNHAIMNAAPIEGNDRWLRLDPYLLGCWLGDGTSRDGSITTEDAEIVNAFKAAGYTVRSRKHKYLYGISGFAKPLRDLGVFDNKHIPEWYVVASESQRLALLQGLMDTDGHCKRNGSVEFCNTNEGLARGVEFLAASLGMKPHWKEKRATLNGKDCGPCYLVHFTPHRPVFRLSRKLARQHFGKTKAQWTHQRMVVSVERVENASTRCITVGSPSHMFLLGRQLVPTCNSMVASVAALWWILAHDNPKTRVVLTATTNHQVRSILWREIKALQRRSRVYLPVPAELPSIGMQWKDGRSMEGFSTKDAEKMAGISSPHLLFIVDEASGVPETIWEAIEGNRAGGAHVLALSNPTQPAGTFYDAFHSKREFWHTIHVDSNEATEHDIPGLAKDWWCEEKLKEWGPDSPLYHVRVLGNFAASAESSVVPLYLVEESQALYHDGEADGNQLTIGLDVARFGDDESVAIAIRGKRVVSLQTWNNLDTLELANRVLALARQYKRPGEPLPHINVDTAGLGAGVADVLRNESDQVTVSDVNGSCSANDDEQYFNLRTESWFSISDWLKSGGQIPPDDKLAGDILAPKYDFDNKGRQKVESKDDIKKRLKRSPDRGDALALAIHQGTQRLAIPITKVNEPMLDYRFGGMGRGF